MEAIHLLSFGAIVAAITGVALPRIRETEHQPLDDGVRKETAGQFLQLSHGITHYEDCGPGDGPVVVLVHGFSVPYHMWDRTVEPLTRAGFRVIRYDLYGRGFSDRPDLRYDRALFVAQLRELLGALGINRPVALIGNSMGGAVVAAFAADYPASVARLVLIDPLWEPLKAGALNLPWIGEWVAASFYVPAAPKLQYRDFYNPILFPEWEILFRRQMMYKGFRRALLATARHFLGNVFIDDYRKLAEAQKPVLQIWGVRERTLRKEGAAVLQSLLHSELIWVEHAAHLPHYERPEVVNEALLRFLAAPTNQTFATDSPDSWFESQTLCG
jgi:pimeloyl-ACP methyl ester carboxylesterase